MQLEYAFLCNAASFLQDGRLVIFGADIDGMECIGFPAVASQLVLVAKFWVFSDEPIEGHTISVELTEPNSGRFALCTNEPLQAIRNLRNDAWPSSAQVTVNLTMGFTRAGTHLFHMIADGNEVKSVPFYVSLIAPTAE